MGKIKNFDEIHQEICEEYLKDKDLFSSLPLNTQIELVNNSNYTALNNSLRHKNEFVSIFYLLNQGKL